MKKQVESNKESKAQNANKSKSAPKLPISPEKGTLTTLSSLLKQRNQMLKQRSIQKSRLQNEKNEIKGQIQVLLQKIEEKEDTSKYHYKQENKNNVYQINKELDITFGPQHATPIVSATPTVRKKKYSNEHQLNMQLLKIQYQNANQLIRETTQIVLKHIKRQKEIFAQSDAIIQSRKNLPPK